MISIVYIKSHSPCGPSLSFKLGSCTRTLGSLGSCTVHVLVLGLRPSEQRPQICSRDLLKPLPQFRDHFPKCSDYHRDCSLHPPHLFELLSQTLVFLQLPMFLLPDVAITWYNYLPLWPSSSCLAITSLSIYTWKSHMMLARSFSTTLGCVPHFDPGTFQAMLGTDVPVYYSSHLLLAFHVCPAC